MEMKTFTRIFFHIDRQGRIIELSVDQRNNKTDVNFFSLVFLSLIASLYAICRSNESSARPLGNHSFLSLYVYMYICIYIRVRTLATSGVLLNRITKCRREKISNNRNQVDYWLLWWQDWQTLGNTEGRSELSIVDNKRNERNDTKKRKKGRGECTEGRYARR